MSTKKWLANNRTIILFILAVFIVWQIALTAVIRLGENFFPTTGLFLYADGENPSWLWSRANFDGIHFLEIAKKGYGVYQQAFFPFYPRLIHLLTPYFDGQDLLAGLTISWASFFLALFLFYKLVLLDWEEKYARRAIIYLLIFPTAFFFSAVYTESLFLFLVLASFYLARTKRWWLAGILGAFASGTRLVGIFLLPALAWEWFEQNKSKLQITNYRLLITFIPLLLIPLGLLYYMRFLQINFHDPLMFLHAQPDKIILLYQVFWRYFKMIATTKWDPLYFTVWLEFLTAAGFLGLLVFGYLRKIRLSYLIFAVSAFITPTLTGTFLSVPRFVLVLFPCFVSLALIKNRIFRTLYFVVCCLLLAIATIFFTRGYFVG